MGAAIITNISDGLEPQVRGQKLAASTSLNTPHTLELFLDYVCPFSKKMFMTVYDSVFPVVKQKYPQKVQFIFRQQNLLPEDELDFLRVLLLHYGEDGVVDCHEHLLAEGTDIVEEELESVRSVEGGGSSQFLARELGVQGHR